LKSLFDTIIYKIRAYPRLDTRRFNSFEHLISNSEWKLYSNRYLLIIILTYYNVKTSVVVRSNSVTEQLKSTLLYKKWFCQKFYWSCCKFLENYTEKFRKWLKYSVCVKILIEWLYETFESVFLTKNKFTDETNKIHFIQYKLSHSQIFQR